MHIYNSVRTYIYICICILRKLNLTLHIWLHSIYRPIKPSHVKFIFHGGHHNKRHCKYPERKHEHGRGVRQQEHRRRAHRPADRASACEHMRIGKPDRHSPPLQLNDGPSRLGQRSNKSEQLFLHVACALACAPTNSCLVRHLDVFVKQRTLLRTHTHTNQMK